MAEAERVVATDCGSTTTKAILIERADGEYRLRGRGEAPTTVETPFDDVTVGVLNAVGELEELTDRRFLADGRVRTPTTENVGADLYLSTSSAGGGLQMLVTGVVKTMTAESAQRAALGAGAIVIDVLAVDDGRQDHQRIERIRSIRPDMILMSGGTEGGTVQHLLDTAELLVAADPRPRLGRDFRLPVIYAGNSAAREGVREVVGERVDVLTVENLRPELERENLGPSREAIHRLFLEHVMAQAPGYDSLLSWTSAPVMSTPRAVGEMVQLAAREEGTDVLAVDIGGATTDVFSVFGEQFNRTVSANLGLSYSVCNVLAEAGVEGIRRWMAVPIAPDELRNRLRNKMIRPTTIPQTVEDLLIEQSVAREALRLALLHHGALAVGLRGVQQARTMGDLFTQAAGGETLVDMMSLGLIIGSGGILSHAPRRAQAAMMLLDAFEPQGVTRLAVDSIFMMPQLGVLASVLPEAAMQVFRRDCLVPLGTVIAPVGGAREGEVMLEWEADGERAELRAGELRRVPLAAGERMKVELRPRRGIDVGAGKGTRWSDSVEGGAVGVILDGRGRPLRLPEEEGERVRQMREWMEALGAMPGYFALRSRATKPAEQGGAV
ncbi:MAG: glutamate mutase L [Armatimonadota bacterium]|nr:MAG: glutamate mutase L [Armatimonadota bacterium]